MKKLILILVYFALSASGCSEKFVDELTEVEIMAQELKEVIRKHEIAQVVCFYRYQEHQQLIEADTDFSVNKTTIQVGEDHCNLRYLIWYYITPYQDNGTTRNRLVLNFEN